MTGRQSSYFFFLARVEDNLEILLNEKRGARQAPLMFYVLVGSLRARSPNFLPFSESMFTT